MIRNLYYPSLISMIGLVLITSVYATPITRNPSFESWDHVPKQIRQQPIHTHTHNYIRPNADLETITIKAYQNRQDTATFTVYGIADSSTAIGGEELRNISEFQVTIENPGILAGCEQAAKAAFQVVANSWESIIPVQVIIRFRSGEGFLALGQPGLFYEHENVSYPAAIFDYISEQDMNPDVFDVDIEVSSAVNWYLDVDEADPPADSYDFQTVLIHEALHGLFMASNYQFGNGSYGMVLREGLPTVFDSFVAVNPINSTTNTDQVCGVLGYFNDSTLHSNPEVQQALTSNRVYFKVQSSLGSGMYPLYAPTTFISGSSIVHEDPSLSGNNVTDPCDYLMYHHIPKGQAIRCIGRMTKRMVSACHLLGISDSGIELPSPCVPGTFNDGSGASSKSTILGMNTTTFYAVVGSVGGAVLVGVLLATGWVIKRTGSKPSYGNSDGAYFPTSTPMNTYNSPHGANGGDADGEKWYYGSGSPGTSQVRSPKSTMMSPGAVRQSHGSKTRSGTMSPQTGSIYASRRESAYVSPKVAGSPIRGARSPSATAAGASSSQEGSRCASRHASVDRSQKPSTNPYGVT